MIKVWLHVFSAHQLALYCNCWSIIGFRLNTHTTRQYTANFPVSNIKTGVTHKHTHTHIQTGLLTWLQSKTLCQLMQLRSEITLIHPAKVQRMLFFNVIQFFFQLLPKKEVWDQKKTLKYHRRSWLRSRRAVGEFSMDAAVLIQPQHFFFWKDNSCCCRLSDQFDLSDGHTPVVLSPLLPFFFSPFQKFEIQNNWALMQNISWDR